MELETSTAITSSASTSTAPGLLSANSGARGAAKPPFQPNSATAAAPAASTETNIRARIRPSCSSALPWWRGTTPRTRACAFVFSPALPWTYTAVANRIFVVRPNGPHQFGWAGPTATAISERPNCARFWLPPFAVGPRAATRSREKRHERATHRSSDVSVWSCGIDRVRRAAGGRGPRPDAGAELVRHRAGQGEGAGQCHRLPHAHLRPALCGGWPEPGQAEQCHGAGL